MAIACLIAYSPYCYDPRTGRFTGEDRVRGIVTLPDSINHYLYCLNDPTVYVDQNGLWPKILEDIGNGIADACDKAETWCEEHKDVVQTVVAVGALTVAAVATVATFGAASPALAAAGAVVFGGCLAVGTATGIDYASHGGSFVEGFNRGVTNTALTATAVMANPVGAVTGMGFQLAGDVFNGHMSSMESYTAAAWSGATMMQTGSAAVGGATYPVIRNGLENLYGVSNHSVGETFSEAGDGWFMGGTMDMTFGYHPYTREQQMCTENAGSSGIPESAKNYDNSKAAGQKVFNLKSKTGKIPEAEYNDILGKSIHNTDADTLTLGKYEPTIEPDGTMNYSKPAPNSYNVVAEKNGDMYFDMKDGLYDQTLNDYSLDYQEMFDEFNIPALDEAASAGKNIRFTVNPELAHGTFTEMEWQYLKKNYGYKYIIRKGDFYYAQQ